MSSFDRSVFLDRLMLHGPDIERTLLGLYGSTHDVTELADRFTRLAARRYAERTEEHRLLDLRRQATPDWFQSETMVHFLPSHCWMRTGPLPS